MLFRKSVKGLSDEALMNRVKDGNERAMEEIYHRHGRSLLRYFLRMLWKDKNKSEDFLHDLFVKIIEKGDQFDATKKFSTWIYSIAHNMCKNEYRKQALRTSVQLHASRFEYADESVTRHLDHESFEKKLDAILKEEDEETRSIFFLRHEQGLSFPEIAEILCCPEGTVKSRLFYLTKKLAFELDHYKIMLEK